MPTITKEAPIHAEIVLSAREYKKFLEALEEYREAQADEKAAKHEKDSCRAKVEHFIQEIGEDYILAGDFRVSYVAAANPTRLDGNLIYGELLNIVSASEADQILERCTVGGGLRSPSLKVIPCKKGED